MFIHSSGGVEASSLSGLLCADSEAVFASNFSIINMTEATYQVSEGINVI